MADNCANGVMHDGKAVAATTTVTNNGTYRVCDACSAMLAAAKARGDILAERITLTKEALPPVLVGKTFVDSTQAEKDAYVALNVREQAALAVATVEATPVADVPADAGGKT